MDHEQPVENERPELETYEALAKLIDYPLLRPELSDDEVRQGCDLAIAYQVAAVVVRPCDVDITVRALRGSGVKVAAAAGFPHGTSTTAAKLYETRDLVRRGAVEIDCVVNTAKLRSRQFPYLETELVQLAKACHDEGAILKAIAEMAYLAEDLKLIACKLVKRAEADFMSTSSGFAPKGYTGADLDLIYRKIKGRGRVKAGHGVQNLDQALDVYRKGADRIGTMHPAEILDAWKTRLEKTAREKAAAAVIS